MLEPGNQKEYRRLCFELKFDQDLPEFSLKLSMLPRVLEAISLAKQIDRTCHREDRAKKDEAQRRRIVEQLDLASESEEGDDETIEVRRQHREASHLARLKSDLSRLLQQVSSKL